MTTSTAPITRLRRHLAVRVRGCPLPELLTSVAVGAGDLYELSRSCHDRGGGGESAVRCGRLIEFAGTDELVALAALVALEPGLLRLADGLRRVGAERDDAEQEVITTALTELRRLAAERRLRPAGAGETELLGRRLLDRTAAALRRSRRQRWQDGERLVPLPDDLDRVDETSDPALLVPRLIEYAQQAHVLSERQARLLAEHVLTGVPVAELARRSGSATAAVWKDAQRARRRLRAFASREVS